MAAVANNPAFAKKAGVPQSVGAEFLKADKGRKFASGGRPDRQALNKPKTNHGKMGFFAQGGEIKDAKHGKAEVAFLERKGAPKSMIEREKKEYGMKKMASGGISTAKMGSVRTAAPSRDGVASKGKTKGTMVKMSGSKPLGMKRGGSCK